MWTSRLCVPSAAVAASVRVFDDPGVMPRMDANALGSRSFSIAVNPRPDVERAVATTGSRVANFT